MANEFEKNKNKPLSEQEQQVLEQERKDRESKKLAETIKYNDDFIEKADFFQLHDLLNNLMESNPAIKEDFNKFIAPTKKLVNDRLENITKEDLETKENTENLKKLNSYKGLVNQINENIKTLQKTKDSNISIFTKAMDFA